MFLARALRIVLVSLVFLIFYLPITLNPEIFERKWHPVVSNMARDSRDCLLLLKNSCY